MSVSRLDALTKQLHPVSQIRRLATAATSIMDINTKYKMLSGYEMPALGYGVSLLTQILVVDDFHSLTSKVSADIDP